MATACRLRPPPNNSSARRRRDLVSNVLRPELGKPGRPDLLSFDQMPEWFQHDRRVSSNGRTTVNTTITNGLSVGIGPYQIRPTSRFAVGSTVTTRRSTYAPISFQPSSSSLASGTSCGTLLADMKIGLPPMPPPSHSSWFRRPSAMHSRRCIIL